MGSPLITEEYRQLLLKYRRFVNSWGGTARKHALDIAAWADDLGAKHILDYGCGNGSLKEALPRGYRWTGYDPCHEAYMEIEDDFQADMVACVDVMEHVEPHATLEVLKDIYNRCTLGAYFLIALVPARAVLPDGRNAHINLQPSEHWEFDLRSVGFEIDHLSKAENFTKFYARKRNKEDVE